MDPLTAGYSPTHALLPHVVLCHQTDPPVGRSRCGAASLLPLGARSLSYTTRPGRVPWTRPRHVHAVSPAGPRSIDVLTDMRAQPGALAALMQGALPAQHPMSLAYMALHLGRRCAPPNPSPPPLCAPPLRRGAEHAPPPEGTASPSSPSTCRAAARRRSASPCTTQARPPRSRSSARRPSIAARWAAAARSGAAEARARGLRSAAVWESRCSRWASRSATRRRATARSASSPRSSALTADKTWRGCSARARPAGPLYVFCSPHAAASSSSSTRNYPIPFTPLCAGSSLLLFVGRCSFLVALCLSFVSSTLKMRYADQTRPHTVRGPHSHSHL